MKYNVLKFNILDLINFRIVLITVRISKKRIYETRNNLVKK